MLSRESKLYTSLRIARNKISILYLGLRSAHHTASVHPSARVSKDVVIEEYGFIANDCHVGPGVTIGRYSMLAPRVAIVGDDHVIDDVGTPAQFSGRPQQHQTLIGRDVWIGFGATILRGITIGEGAIIGAGAVVTKNVPPYEVWAGVPASFRAERMPKVAANQHSARINGRLIKPTFASAQTIDN